MHLPKRLDSWMQDIRYAARGFRRTPGLALTVVATIGLGLGLNTTLFTLFNAYVLRPYVLQDPQRLYTFTWSSKAAEWNDFSWPQYQHLLQDGTVFTDTLAYRDMIGALNGRRAFGQLVTGNYFSVTGSGVRMGRPLTPDDSRSPGSEPVMVLGHSAWQNQFGGDPGVIGRKVILRGQPFEVVGVANAEFSGLEQVGIDYWIPITMVKAVGGGPDLFGPGHPSGMRVVGRLKRGMTVDAAKAALLAWSARMTADGPAEEHANGLRLMSRATPIPLTPNVLLAISPVVVGFGLVLLISCANVSNMMLARAISRQREMGIRISLGAGRGRLIRQMLVESVMLALPAAAAGLLISELTKELAQRIVYATLPAAIAKIFTLQDLTPDARVFGFILLASVGATLLFGLAPAIQTSGSSLAQANRGEFGNEFRPSRLRNVLVVTQVTICALLLISAGVVLRSEGRVAGTDTGMATQGVFDIQLPERFQAKAAERLEADPAVETVAAAWYAPLATVMRQVDVVPSVGQSLRAGHIFVSPEYFSVFRIPLLRGRMFKAAEANSQAPVVIVSEATARRFWSGADPLGKTIVLPRHRQRDPSRSGRAAAFSAVEVIGVAKDVTNGWIAAGKDPTCIYFPTSVRASGNQSLLVRVKGDPEAGRRRIDEALDQVGLSISDQVQSMDEVLAETVYAFRLTFWLAAFLGGLALLLTVSGIYGVLSFLVGQRTREIGIRVALGAGHWTVVRMVVRQSMGLAALGTAIGAGISLAIAPVFAHQIEAVKPYDPAAYIGGALFVILAALAACYQPSRRASKIDPSITLRCD